MRNSPEHVVDAIFKHTTDAIRSDIPTAYLGQWIASEDEDVNLSQVRIDGKVWRYVPKGDHVTGLTVDSAVIVLKFPGIVAYISQVLVGDTTIAKTDPFNV